MNIIKIGKIRTNTEEIKHITKAWLAISLAFAILLAIYDVKISLFSMQFTSLFLVAAITVGLGFLLHELSHKIVAQHYHYSAEFRSNNLMLILAIVTGFLGIIFAAPGAVMIKAYYIDKTKNGKISLAGPLTNIILGIIFLLLNLTLNTTPGSFQSYIFSYGAMINIWLGIFNMIPIWDLDGKKVLEWSKPVYFVTIITAVILLIVNQVI